MLSRKCALLASAPNTYVCSAALPAARRRIYNRRSYLSISPNRRPLCRAIHAVIPAAPLSHSYFCRQEVSPRSCGSIGIEGNRQRHRKPRASALSDYHGNEGTSKVAGIHAGSSQTDAATSTCIMLHSSVKSIRCLHSHLAAVPTRSFTPPPRALQFTPSPRMLAPYSADASIKISPVHTAPPMRADRVNGFLESVSDEAFSSETQLSCPGSTSAAGHKSTDQETPVDQLQHNSTAVATKSESEHLGRQSESVSSGERHGGTETDHVQEEHIPLSYQIPPNALRAAMQASQNTKGSYWSHQLYRGPRNELLNIHYCRTMDVSERVAQYFLHEKVVGFDIEWKPWAPASSIKQNASLIQLACENRIALFHISLFPGNTPKQLLPPTVKAILESPDIYKVGVAVKSDFRRLEKFLGVNPQGVFELSRLRNLVEHYATDPSKVNFKLVSLAKQVEQYLQLPLFKGGRLEGDSANSQSVRESDWSQGLNLDQIRYAAADAYAGFRLWDVLESKRKKLRPTPPLPELCDLDGKSKPKSKFAKTPGEVAARALDVCETEGQAIDASRECQKYEIATEGMNGHELELDLTTESAEEAYDPDDEDTAVRRVHENLHGDIVQNLFTRQQDVAPQRVHQASRINLSSLKAVDPRYSTLLKISSDEDGFYSDSPGASDSLPKASVRRCNQKNDVRPMDRSVQKTDSPVDEYADLELEEALVAMDIDEQSPKLGFEPVPVEQRPQPEQNSRTEELPKECRDDEAYNVTSTETDGNTAKDSELTPPVQYDNALTFTSVIPPNATSTKSSEWISATQWAQSYLYSAIPSPSSTASTRIHATVTPLRAYHLWHHQHLSLHDIATHLQDPPLALSTVCNYIIQAVTLERLSYTNEGMRTVLRTLPPSQRGRWTWLISQVGGI